jgi:hypothetical protein
VTPISRHLAVNPVQWLIERAREFEAENSVTEPNQRGLDRTPFDHIRTREIGRWLAAAGKRLRKGPQNEKRRKLSLAAFSVNP